MKKCIQSIRSRTAGAVKVAMLAAVMAFSVPAFVGAPAASAQAVTWPELAIQVGPLRICLLYCWLAGYCCEVEGQL